MISPFKSDEFRITSIYGDRVMNGVKSFHSGLDLVGIGSTQVCAVMSGKVVVSQIITDKKNKTWEWGNYICIYGDDGHYYYYCHLATRNVVVGAKVTKGQIIGIMGNTGYSLGAHLHLEIRDKNGTTTINPATFLGVTNKIGVYKIDSLTANLDVLVQYGVINTPAYWLANADKLKYLPELIAKMARTLKKYEPKI